jgi:hypothetical protein
MAGRNAQAPWAKIARFRLGLSQFTGSQKEIAARGAFAKPLMVCKNAGGGVAIYMKRFFASIGFLVLFLSLLSSHFPRTAFAQTAEREWLILVYVSAINDRGLNGSAREMINQLEKVGSSDKVAVVLKYGILETDANKTLKFPDRLITLLIQKDASNPDITSPVIDSTPVQDMAGENSLYLFARKNILKYPAKKVMLFFFGKGDGWNGLSQDDLSQKTMSIGSLAGAFSKIVKGTGKKIDLFVTDADCMQSVEIIYALKDYVDVIVGSAEKGPRLGFMYDFVLDEPMNNPAWDAKKVANGIVYFSENLATSAVAADKIPGFMPLLDKWADAVMADPIAMKTALQEAKNTLSFALKDSRDLCEFIERITKALPAQHPAARAGIDLWKYVANELILASQKTFMDQDSGKILSKPEYEKVRGLAIYLPVLNYNSSMYESLAFASNSKWNRFLLALCNEALKPEDGKAGFAPQKEQRKDATD